MKERRNNLNYIRKSIYVLFIVAALLVSTVNVFASGSKNDLMPQLDNCKDSLTITFNYDDNGEKTAVSGVQLEIYKVAGVSVKFGSVTYSLEPDFADSGLDFAGMTAEQSREYANKLCQVVENKGFSGTQAVTDANGKVKFSNLTHGMYLVQQVGKKGEAKKYENITPYLVLVPGITKQKEWQYDVNSFPKSEIVKKPGTPVTIDPPVKKEISGDKPGKDQLFKFVLEAQDADTPMPEGTKDGKKEVTIKGAGEKEFGVITYDKEGTYVYKIYEVNTGAENYEYDKTEYKLMCIVTNVEGDLTIEKKIYANNKEGVYEEPLVFTFVNKYNEPPVPTPKTGDDFNLKLIVGILLAAVAGGSLVVATGRRNRKDEKKS